jgi:tetratricopeptide (TPR) repeat protein
MRIDREKQFLLGLFVAGLLVRVIYFFEYRSFLEFFHPTVDALYHHLAAMAIAAGGLTSPEPFFRAPFYNYFLGLIYFLTHDSISAARFVQLVLGAFTPCLTYLIARRVFNRRIAAIAAALTLLCGDFVYFEGELLLEFLVVSLALLTWFCYLRFSERGRVAWLILAGLTTGLAVVTRPNAFVIVPVIGYLLWEKRLALTSMAMYRFAAKYLVAMLIPIALVLLHNATRLEPAVTLATQGGINFYIGNNAEADGVSAVMPGKLGFNWQYNDIKYEAETATGRALTSPQVSDYYYRLAIRDIRSHPLHWLSLEIRKLYLVLSGADISNNRNLIAFRSQFVSLKLLPIGMAILAPLGLVGMALAVRRSPQSRGMIIFVVLYILSFVLFFVNSRFRLPTLPFFAIFSGVALAELYNRVRNRSTKQVVALALPIVALGFLLNANLYRLDFDNRRQTYFSKGNLLREAGDFSGALDNYFQSLSLGPPLKQVYLNIGLVNLQQKQYDSARFYFLLEDSLSGGSAEALNDLAFLNRQLKEQSAAIRYARQSLAIKPYLEEARLNLWYAFRDAGFPDSVYASIDAYRKTNRLSLRQQFIYAIVASDLQRFDEAESLLRELLRESKIRTQPLYAEASGTTPSGAGADSEAFRANVLYNLGYALGALGKIDSAIVYFDAAVAVNPGLMEGWLNLGSAHFARKDFAVAKRAFLRAAQLNPQSDIVTYNLALVHVATGELTEAREYVEQCLTIRPDFPLARALAAKLQQMR